MTRISDRIAAELTEDQLRAEYEEAVERVYAGRTWPEYPCDEHGHGECAFTDGGPCTSEQIDREIGRMRVQARLEYLRGEIEAERISYGEIAELQGLAEHIDPSDTLLRQWAGIEENDDDATD